jgi:hypothetical protein
MAGFTVVTVTYVLSDVVGIRSQISFFVLITRMRVKYLPPGGNPVAVTEYVSYICAVQFDVAVMTIVKHFCPRFWYHAVGPEEENALFR